MKYALLIYPKPGSHEELPDAERAAVLDDYFALADEEFVIDSHGLQGPASATTVRLDGADTLITDGPFANTKEVIGGYYLVNVADLDAALEAAQRIPALRLGGAVEVRPVLEYER